jgi:quercetin dioxygenase-like cupin family protein
VNSAAPRPVRRFSSEAGDAVVDFGHGILITGGLDAREGVSMSAYTAFFAAEARADLGAPYAEIWVVLIGTLRLGTETDGVTVRAGDYVHVPEQAAGVVEAIDDAKVICVSVPAH